MNITFGLATVFTNPVLRVLSSKLPSGVILSCTYHIMEQQIKSISVLNKLQIALLPVPYAVQYFLVCHYTAGRYYQVR